MFVKPSLKQFFLSRADYPNQMETLRVPLDERQSPNFISFRAVRRWWVLYDIEKCIYMPSSIFEQRKKELGKSMFIRDVSLAHPNWKETSYVGITAGAIRSGIRYYDVIDFLNELQQGLVKIEEKSFIGNKPEHYFREFEHK